MKRKLVYILVGVIVIIIIGGFIIPFSLITNNSIISTRIYYKINYKGNVKNLESIIEKSEIFEYEKYCKYRDHRGEVHNLSRADYYDQGFIDLEFIESLKLKIDKDKTNFHFFPPYYQHNFHYSLETSNESLVYLTYNNNSIIKAEYANHTEIFSIYQIGSWYINFTQIPFAPNISSTIVVNNIILVKMNLKYYYDHGFESEGLTIEQFLIFNSNFQTMLICIPLATFSIS